MKWSEQFSEDEKGILFHALQVYRTSIVDEMVDGNVNSELRKNYKIATELRDRFLE